MKKRFQLLAATALTSLAVTTPLFWFFERGNPSVRNLGDAVWWWLVTASTVGYGDIVPVTVPGRIVAAAAIVTGFFVFANLIGIAAESVHEFVERRARGTASVKARNHIVICEYTAVADELIQSLASHPLLRDRPVVTVTSLVSQNPYPQHHFVRGVPIDPTTLQRASIATAAYVFVFANLRFTDPDIKTLHVALRVADLNPTAKVMVEMLDPDNELLQHVPDTFRPMDSRSLIRSVFLDRKVDIDAWIGTAAD